MKRQEELEEALAWHLSCLMPNLINATLAVLQSSAFKDFAILRRHSETAALAEK